LPKLYFSYSGMYAVVAVLDGLSLWEIKVNIGHVVVKRQMYLMYRKYFTG